MHHHPHNGWDTASELLCKGIEIAGVLAFFVSVFLLWVGTPA